MGTEGAGIEPAPAAPGYRVPNGRLTIRPTFPSFALRHKRGTSLAAGRGQRERITGDAGRPTMARGAEGAGVEPAPAMPGYRLASGRLTVRPTFHTNNRSRRRVTPSGWVTCWVCRLKNGLMETTGLRPARAQKGPISRRTEGVRDASQGDTSPRPPWPPDSSRGCTRRRQGAYRAGR